MNQLTDLAVNTADFGGPQPHAPRIAVICARWHEDIVFQARDSLIAEFDRNDISSNQLEHFDTAGALEIPLLAKKLATTGRFDAIIAVALVVNGGIYRHEFVCSAVLDGMMRVQLDTDVPILSAVLTPRDFHSSDEHVQFFREHFVKKGVEVAQAAMQTIYSLRAIAA